MDETGHVRRPSADDEIADRVAVLAQLAAQEVMLVTADTGMAFRARANGVDVLKLALD